MINKTLKLSKIESIIDDLLLFLKKNEEYLKKKNKLITGDTDYWIDNDFDFVIRYLSNFVRNNKEKLNYRQPKGSVCVILSYNEPLIISIIPVFNCLIAGNSLTLKPSKRNKEIVNDIWFGSNIVKKYKLPLSVVDWNRLDFSKNVSNFNSVVFFGSYYNAKEVSKQCGDNYVEFLPEIEGADVSVITKNNQRELTEKRIKSMLCESFSHSGQTCQRIHGVYVHKSIYKKYVKKMKDVFLSDFDIEKHIDSKKIFSEDKLSKVRRDIANSKPSNVFVNNFKNFARIVVSPDISSSFINKAYFFPTFWIYPYSKKEEIIELLKRRTFRMGLNIQSKNKNSDFVEYIINNTNYARYTVNTSHVSISHTEGWGGNWPSGFRGYCNWLDYFSNLYTVIKN